MSAVLGCRPGACALDGSRHPIASVQVVDRSVGRGVPVRFDRSHIEGRARDLAEHWTGFGVRAPRGDEIPWQLTVEIQLIAERPAAPDDAGTAREGYIHRACGVSVVLAELRPGFVGLERHEASALVSRDVRASDALEVLVEEAMREAARKVGIGLALADADEPTLVEALSSADRGTRERAILMVGERRARGAVPRLVEIVRSEEEEQDTVLKAVGALVAIGDERAVGALIDAGRRRSSAYLGQILFAVAQLGGKQAEAYLFTVSQGHPDPDVRRNASDALNELRREKSAAEPGMPSTRVEE